jgi:hypothetical protein
MKLTNEIRNGVTIFIGIGIYFIIMNIVGLSDVFSLRLFNVVFILYGVNKTIVTNIINGNKDFLSNAISAFSTALIGVFLSIIGLLTYSYSNGGDAFIQNLSKTFLFGGNPSVNIYCISLFVEGIASSVIVTLLLMFYYNNKYLSD